MDTAMIEPRRAQGGSRVTSSGRVPMVVTTEPGSADDTAADSCAGWPGAGVLPAAAAAGGGGAPGTAAAGRTSCTEVVGPAAVGAAGSPPQAERLSSSPIPAASDLIVFM